MGTDTVMIILEELKYIRAKVDAIEAKMVTKEECRANIEECPVVKKKLLT